LDVVGHSVLLMAAGSVCTPEVGFAGYAAFDVFKKSAVAFLLLRVFHAWARERQAINKHISTFNVRECVCFVEADRPFVYGQIAMLMRAVRQVDEDDDDDAALDAFNLLVRSRVGIAITSSVGAVGFRYKHIVGVYFIVKLSEFIDRIHYMNGFRFNFGQFVYTLLMIFVTYPGSMLILAYVADWCVHLQGWRWNLVCSMASFFYSIMVMSQLAGASWAVWPDEPRMDVLRSIGVEVVDPKAAADIPASHILPTTCVFLVALGAWVYHIFMGLTPKIDLPRLTRRLGSSISRFTSTTSKQA